ncbi:heparan-alpha-glucosaminide N-acetyltransferase [Pelagimonas varians]|uniref:Heparan-alpha-glucosaminide N-acetyltransferase catalytic domain-containing protein n=1 Tax=Pelagimonas varians TaxID=696760 RepID=A0A238L4Y9_9RHOB|nr:heparan-alpha-glucosaminide N-acetyltransferase [Pelagimonas varians]PYG26263.1 putative membrane protein [Pelagimonas varians]SMX50048.1 hypothetical protein PEV8663_04459 [Pelagimonas varians]
MISSNVQTEGGNSLRTQQRLIVLDVLRSTALLGMIVFHFARDLEMFGYVDEGTTMSGGWALFARFIAGSFLLLAGVSLSLAHSSGIRWAAFFRRLVIVSTAALAITLTTYAAVPEQFIYFGVLHVIAVSSLVGLIFLKLPMPTVFFATACAFFLPDVFRTDVLNHPGLTWIGLSTRWRPSLDFLPLLPWVSPFLAGICIARIFVRFGVWHVPKQARQTPGQVVWMLAWSGRHSLAIYLIHQPFLIGLLWLFSNL